MIVSGVIAFVIIGGSLYFYLYSQKKQDADSALINSLKDSLDASSPQLQLHSSLLKAQANLQMQTNRLTDMQNALITQQQFSSAMKSGYDIVDSAVKKTDVISKKIQDEVTTKRQQVTDALNLWKDLIARTPKDGATDEVRALAQAYAETAQSYLAELQDVVDNLTPETSGLTQSQIDSYVALVQDASRSVDSVVQTLLPPPPPAAPQTTVVVAAGNDYVPPAPIVTPVAPADVVHQETVVADAQNQVEILQDQINQEQQASSTNQNPPPPPAGNGQQDIYTTPYSDYSTAQGIVTQPGDPELVPGANRYDNPQ